MASMNPGIILAGQQPDFVNTLARASQAAGVTNEVQRQNALAQVYKQHGAGIVQGEQGAINALAGLDPMAALGVQDARQTMDIRGQENARADERLQLAREQSRRAVEQHIASMSAEKRKAEAERLDKALAMGSQAQTPEQWDQAMQMVGADDLVGQFEQRDVLVAGALGVKDALEMNAPKEPLSTEGKLYSDIENGFVPKEALAPKPADEYQRYVQEEKAAGREPLSRIEYERALDAPVGPQSTAGQFYADRNAGLIPEGMEYKGGGVNVNVGSEVGTIPQGYELFTDPETGARRLRPLAGGPEDTTKKDAARTSAQETSGDVILNAAARAAKASEERVATGLAGSIASYNPSNNNAEVYRQVDVLKSNATIEALNAMRQQSPTGGALGNVTEGEGQMLAARAGALDPASPTFDRDLADYTRTLMRVIHGREAGDRIFDSKWGAGGRTEAMQSGDKSAKPVPQAAPDFLSAQDQDLWDIMTEPERRAILGTYGEWK